MGLSGAVLRAHRGGAHQTHDCALQIADGGVIPMVGQPVHPSQERESAYGLVLREPVLAFIDHL